MPPRPYRNYTDQQIIDAVKNSISIAEVCRKINIVAKGGNFRTVWRNIHRLGLDTSHMLHQGHNKGKRFKPIKNYKSNYRVKVCLLEKRSHRCESCGLEKWMGKPIPLELHHVDGNSMNNEENNLQLLCPNCHALTHNYKNKKRVTK
tara:strand:- start:13 stop:453 length:441 start_codon:yes stop_codon:yes gene_type:complete